MKIAVFFAWWKHAEETWQNLQQVESCAHRDGWDLRTGYHKWQREGQGKWFHKTCTVWPNMRLKR